MKVKEGQVWIENDPRNAKYYGGEIYKRVVYVGDKYALVMSKRINGIEKQTKIRLDRFNGKHGGYSLVKGIKEV